MKLNRVLLRGSFVLLIAFGVFNLLNFVFQFAMARMLTIEQYGIMATLFSIIYIFSVFADSIQTVIAKYSSNESDDRKIKNIIKRSLRKTTFLAVSLFFVYLIVSIPLSWLLKINYVILAGNGLVVFAVFMLPISRGVMQGKKRFGTLGVNMVLESAIKLIVAFTLVFIGWSIYGAVIGVVIGPTAAFLLSLIPLKKTLKTEEKKAEIIDWKNYSKSTFFIIFIITSFYSIDIILAKLVFSPEVAGAYAISSILAKAIFWGTQPISRVMFPISSEKNRANRSKQEVLKNSLLILIVLIIIALLIFYLFPDFIVKIFTGRSIEISSNLLFYIGLAMGILSITNVVLLYKLSTNSIRGYHYLIIFLIIEIVLLFYFSSSLLEFTIALITASLGLLIASIFLLRE